MIREEKRRENLREIQILRAIAFIFVLLQHSLGGTPTNFDLPNSIIMAGGFLNTFAEPAVPIFLFISGLTLTYSYKDKLDLKKYYKNRICYLIIPYFIWSFINMCLHNPEKISNFFMETIAGNGMFHLWYMGMIIRMALFFPIIIYIGRFISKRNKFIQIATFLMLFIGYHYVSAEQYLIQNTVAGILFGTPDDLQMRAVSLSFLFWGIYVVIGVFAGFNYNLFKEKVIKYRYVIYACFIAFFFYKYQIKYDGIPYSRTSDILYRSSNILFFYLLSCKLITKIKIASVLNFIGKYSYAAYMIHMFVLNNFIFGLQGIGIDHRIYNAILSAGLASIVSTFMVFCISLIPKSRIITGVKDNYKYYLEVKESYNKKEFFNID